ncbi:MAG: DUF2283 domain-containing protein [Synechococcales cyanobacterium RM1_1_8]|nr:DUF2283 domain-containing protein [Synechococcales cyanobacterium RM1_1_8]
MKIIYDPNKDILQISFNPIRVIEETTQIAPGLILDYDEDGQVIGIELRKASQKMASPNGITYEVGSINLDKPQPKVSRDFT